MNNSDRTSHLAHLLSAAALAAAMLAAPAWAQQGNLAKSLEGTWTLKSIYNETDGKRSDVFGTEPTGRLVLTPGGRFVMVIMKSGLPAFASNNRVKGTPEENQAVIHGSVAYFGTYAVANEKENSVSMKIEACTFPNWNGQEQKRVMVVNGDELSLTNPTTAVGGTNFVVWKRAE